MNGGSKFSLFSWFDRSRWITALRVRLKVWRCKGFSFRKLAEIEARAKRSAVWTALEIEAAKSRALDFGDPLDALKYLHTDFWLRENVIRAAALGLHRPPRLKILDLGTGSALFPYVCSLLGHEVAGLDKPFDCCRPDELNVYSVLPAVLGVPVQRTCINAFEPIGLTGTYDLITAFMICFNNHQQADEWEAEEWRFFLSDLCQYVNPGGRVSLAFNPHVERYGALKFYDEAILSLLTGWGRMEETGQITILRDRVLGSAAHAVSVSVLEPLRNQLVSGAP
jgi:hypothetical protein